MSLNLTGGNQRGLWGFMKHTCFNFKYGITIIQNTNALQNNKHSACTRGPLLLSWVVWLTNSGMSNSVTLHWAARFRWPWTVTAPSTASSTRRLSVLLIKPGSCPQSTHEVHGTSAVTRYAPSRVSMLPSMQAPSVICLLRTSQYT